MKKKNKKKSAKASTAKQKAGTAALHGTKAPLAAGEGFADKLAKKFGW